MIQVYPPTNMQSMSLDLFERSWQDAYPTAITFRDHGYQPNVAGMCLVIRRRKLIMFKPSDPIYSQTTWTRMSHPCDVTICLDTGIFSRIAEQRKMRLPAAYEQWFIEAVEHHNSHIAAMTWTLLWKSFMQWTSGFKLLKALCPPMTIYWWYCGARHDNAVIAYLQHRTLPEVLYWSRSFKVYDILSELLRYDKISVAVGDWCFQCTVYDFD